MIAPDANLLIYAYAPFDPFHPASRDWLESVLSGSKLVGIPIHSIYAYLRVLTHARSTAIPLTFAQAAEIVNSCLALPHVDILFQASATGICYSRSRSRCGLAERNITDAPNAAVAMEYSAVISSNGRVFASFPGLRWINPLQGDWCRRPHRDASMA